MKKYLPVLLSSMFFSAFLAGQIIFDRTGIFARQSSIEKKLAAHYASVYEKTIFTDLDEAPLVLSNIKAPIVILNFWASWCLPCLRELPSLVELAKRYGPQEILVLGINTDEEEQLVNIAKTRKKYQINFPIIPDKDGKILQDFMVSNIPMSLIFYDGKIVKIIKGQEDFQSIEMIKWLDRLLEQAR